MDYQHIVSHFLDVYDPAVNEYEDGSSFIGYMITKFGEKETIDMMFPSNTITGDTYHELLAEWKTYVQTNYSEYLIDSNEKRD